MSPRIPSRALAVLAACLSATLVGCAYSDRAYYGRDFDPHGQIQALIQEEARRLCCFGHLAPGITSSQELEKEPTAAPAITTDKYSLTFVRLDGARICFETRLRIGSPAEQQAEAEHLREGRAFVVQAHRSLEEITPETRWPTPGERTLDSVTVHKSTAWQRHGSMGPHAAKDPAAELCGPAPDITPETRFLTVAVLSKDSSEPHYFLVWDFKGQRR